jgi:hypothetical protein
MLGDRNCCPRGGNWGTESWVTCSKSTQHGGHQLGWDILWRSHYPCPCNCHSGLAPLCILFPWPSPEEANIQETSTNSTAWTALLGTASGADRKSGPGEQRFTFLGGVSRVDGGQLAVLSNEGFVLGDLQRLTRWYGLGTDLSVSPRSLDSSAVPHLTHLMLVAGHGEG